MKFLVLLPLLAAAYCNEIVVKAPAGNWRGSSQTIEGVEVHSFKGVRYGQAPVGDLRFKRPLAEDDFDLRVEDAKEYGYACIQPLDPLLTTHEDCLNLNIWVPKTGKKNLPVMFWIYGGAYIFGSTTFIYDGAALAALGEVIVVNVNYRLGLLGFFYGDSDDTPGNQGIYDQILALKWLQRNIAALGGDPSQVTIFGESAGSWSTTALVLSPLAAGLFRRAISQSGAINSDAVSRSPEWGRAEIVRHAKTFGCDGGRQAPTREVVECMRKISGRKLAIAGTIPGNSRLVWGTELLPERPIVALKNGNFSKDIDYMFGVNENEGALFVALTLNVHGAWDFIPGLPPLTMSVAKAKEYITYILTLLRVPGLTDAEIAKTADFYTAGLTDNDKEELRKRVARVEGDFMLVCPTILFGEHVGGAAVARGHSAYSYRLTYGTHALKQLGSICGGWMGVCHAEDIPFVFGWPFGGSPVSFIFNEDDKRLSRDVIKAWSSFAKTGKIDSIEGHKWERAVKGVENPSVQYMELNPRGFRMVADRYKDTCDRVMKTYLDQV